MKTALYIATGFFIAFVFVELNKKRWGSMDFEYDEQWLGDLTGLREDK